MSTCVDSQGQGLSESSVVLSDNEVRCQKDGRDRCRDEKRCMRDRLTMAIVAVAISWIGRIWALIADTARLGAQLSVGLGLWSSGLGNSDDTAPAGIVLSAHVLVSISCFSEAIFLPKTWTTSLLVLDIDAACLVGCQLHGQSLSNPSRTSLPVWTHLLQGRFVSHARCFRLQLTHADGTCALALRATPGAPDVKC